MGDVSLVKSKYTDSDVTSLGELASADNAKIPGTIEGASTAKFGTGIAVGGATPRTGGIAFPATAVAVADVNTLDDYEEGSWTPDLQFGGAKVGITYTSGYQTGKYIKIGTMVTVTGVIVLTSKGSSNGSATIAGLPFTNANANGAYTPCLLHYDKITFANQHQEKILPNVSYISLQEVTEAGVLTDLIDADFANDSTILISATYFVE
jgi:hypothetical protein